MDSKIIENKFDENLEEIASIVHDIWAHWQSYLHDQCEKQLDGSLKIPKDLVEHWNEQIKLDYNQLSEDDKKSDIEQALKYKKIFLKFINEVIETKRLE